MLWTYDEGKNHSIKCRIATVFQLFPEDTVSTFRLTSSLELC